MAGMKEKKINTLFNRDGNLISMLYNDSTRRYPTDRRVTFKRIIDQALGIDTQGDHNFLIGEDLLKELEEAAKNIMTEEEMEEAKEKELMLKRKEEAEEKQRKREERKRQEELDALDDDELGYGGGDDEEKKEKKKGGEGQGEKGETKKDGEGGEEEEDEGIFESMGEGGDGVASVQQAEGGMGGEGGGAEGYQTQWEEFYDDAGNVYYYNHQTGASQYEYPEEWAAMYQQ